MKKLLFFITIIIIIIISATLITEYYAGKPSFCRSCHIMESSYNSWSKSSHSDVACVDCHYAPGERFTMKAKYKGIGQFFTYLSIDDKEVRRPTVVSDLSCTQAGCHSDETRKERELNYRGKIRFLHASHDKALVDGMSLHCDSCHRHILEERHFEVPSGTCFTCHFTNASFNKGRANCSLCHDVPHKALLAREQEKEALGKPGAGSTVCMGCHEPIGEEKQKIVLETCLRCHDRPANLDRLQDRKALHEIHVSGQKANCSDCHDRLWHEGK